MLSLSEPPTFRALAVVVVLGLFALFSGAFGSAWAGAGRAIFTDPDSETCRASYYALLQETTCERLFKFQSTCPRNSYAPVVATALRLRCADQLLEKLYTQMKKDFAAAEQAKTCAAFTSFSDKYALEFDLAEVPEMDQAAGLRIKICEEEARRKEIAALEKELEDAIRKNDCATFEAFERQKGPKLEAEQNSRLLVVKKSRCEAEKAIADKLQSCLERANRTGEFCLASTCYADYEREITKPDTNGFASEIRKSKDICEKHREMTACFSRDPCGGERCSLPLRLAIETGPLLGHTEKIEQSARGQCEAIRERERLAELARQEEERRREAELAAERRAENTVKFKACNQSSKGKIYFVMMYYDYDASDWIVEGWWHIPQGGCIYVGDQVRRGTVYFYAHANRERYVWSGSFGLCVSWDRFRRVNKPRSCSSKNFRRFIEKYIDQSEYEQNFVD